MILLIGNYRLDRQQSMQRFAMMMLTGLKAAGVSVEVIEPSPFLGRFRYAGNFVAKWLAYLDKFVLFRRALAKKLREQPAIVHICDHSNAMYSRAIRGVPVVVTCHDLLAVRGALGEQTETPASATGKKLQRWIVQGLEDADAVACVSRATLADAHQLIQRRGGRPALQQITLGLSYPYQKLPPEEARARLATIRVLQPDTQFVLHVGANMSRKNRSGILRIFARCKDLWNGSLVFAGEPLSPPLHSLGAELGISDRIIDVPDVDSRLLEALYNCATALLFPSTFEGFGWPIAEAHACGCPVLCVDREPMSEVAGAAGLLHPVDDEEGFAADLLRLTDPAERARWSALALENAKRFSTARMIAEYRELYHSLSPAA